MNWSIWKSGLFIAALTGLLTGVGAYQVADKINWHSFALFMVACVAKDALLYLKSHPLPTADRAQLGLNLMLICCLSCLAGGCALQRVSEFNPETKLETRYTGFSMLNRSALEGLSVGKRTRTSATVFSLQKGGTETQSEAIQALGEAIGGAVAAGVKTAVKP